MSIEISSESPAICGVVYEELIVQQYWYKGNLAEEVNLVFLKFAGQWYRFGIDCGEIQWRRHDRHPEAWSAGADYSYPMVDVGRQSNIRGAFLERIVPSATGGATTVAFYFATGLSLEFRNSSDRTTYRIAPISHGPQR